MVSIFFLFSRERLVCSWKVFFEEFFVRVGGEFLGDMFW